MKLADLDPKVIHAIKERRFDWFVEKLESCDGQSLMLFLRDTTYCADPEREWAEAGFVAVCDKLEGEDFFIATLYHQCYLVDEMTKRRKTNQR
jgi:hypothetical protein